MEALIEKLKLEYTIESTTQKDDGSAEIDCGRLTERLDHFTCGEEDCSCEEKEGWCEDAWEEECVRPLKEEFAEWMAKNLKDEPFTATCSVCEKGGFYIYITPTRAAEAAEEPEAKRVKTTTSS